jgi:hypothetical protein
MHKPIPFQLGPSACGTKTLRPSSPAWLISGKTDDVAVPHISHTRLCPSLPRQRSPTRVPEIHTSHPPFIRSSLLGPLLLSKPEKCIRLRRRLSGPLMVAFVPAAKGDLSTGGHAKVSLFITCPVL